MRISASQGHHLGDGVIVDVPSLGWFDKNTIELLASNFVGDYS